MSTAEEKEIIRKNDSERGAYAVSFLWSKLKTKQERKERMAVVNYARQVKLYDKETADQWLTKKFGSEKAQIMLSQNSFRRQWIKHI